MANPKVIIIDGASTGDLSRLNQANGTVTADSTIKYTGAYSYKLNDGSNMRWPSSATSYTGLMCINAWVRWDTIETTAYSALLEVFQSSNGNISFSLGVGTSKLKLLNANSSTIETGTTTLVADTWYHIQLTVDVNNSSGAYRLYLDGVQELDGTAQDFTDAGTADYVWFGGCTGTNNEYTYVDDVVVIEDCVDIDDGYNLYYQPRVHRYRSTLASSAGEAGFADTALDAGNWNDTQAVSPVDTGFAEYSGGTSQGMCMYNDAGGSAGTGGPNTDTEVGDHIVAARYAWRAKRSGGGGTAQWGIASGSQTAGNVTGGLSADSGKTLDVSSQMSFIADIAFNDDGTKLYVCEGVNGSSDIFQYDLSTAWDLSTGSYASKSLTLDTQLSGWPSFSIGADEIIVADTSTGDLYQYSMSTAWDISTATYTRTKTASAYTTVAVAPDGLTAITSAASSQTTLHVTMTTAWDVSTASATAGNNVVNTNEDFYQFSNDGRYLLSGNGGTFLCYKLMSPFSAQGLQGPMGVYAFDPYTNADSVGGVCFGDDGKRLFVAPQQPSGSGNGLIKSYTFATGSEYTAWNTNASFLSTDMTVTADLNLTTSVVEYEAYSETNYPRPSEYALQGFRKDGGGQDFDVSWMGSEYVSVLNTPVSSVPRNVTQDPEQAGDQSTITLTANAATVTLPDFSRTVTGTTEVIELDGTNYPATVTKNVGREATGSTVAKKQWKAPNSAVYAFDGIQDSGGDASVGNMLDSNLGTYCAPGSVFTYGIGMSDVGPYSSVTAKPIKIEIRAYITDGDLDIRAGWSYDQNRDFNTPATVYAELENIHDNVGYPVEGWTDWAELNYGYNWWGDDGATDYTEPLTWSMIQDKLVIGCHYAGGTSGGRIYSIEVRITEADTTQTSGYFDGNVAVNDNVNSWSNDSNAADGSTSTWASTTTPQLTSNLGVEGNTITKTGGYEDEIIAVYVRARLRLQFNGGTPYVGGNIHMRDAGSTQSLALFGATGTSSYCSPNYGTGLIGTGYTTAAWEVSTTNTAWWTAWYKIDYENSIRPTQKNWTDIAAMEMQIRRLLDDDNGATLEFAKGEIVVISSPPNSSRKGSKVGKKRKVNGDPEVIEATGTLASVSRPIDMVTTPEAITVAGTQATVERDRVVTGATEVIEEDGTNYPAEVSFASSLNVTGTTAAVELDGTNYPATITRDRVVTGQTESVLATGTPSGVNGRRVVGSQVSLNAVIGTLANVNAARGTIGDTEAVTAAGTDASIVTQVPRTVTGTTEVVELDGTNYPATVERDRVATGATEVVTQSASSAINRSRRMITPSEEIVVAEGAAAAVRDRVVTGITEVTLLDGTNFPADISFPIVVAGVTEVVTVGENAANVDATRNVGGSTEAITVTGTNAIVSTSANRIVTGLVESITLIENASVVERDRVVVGTTEVVTINNPISDTNWNRIVTGATEVVTAAGTDASIVTQVPRTVTGTTEVVELDGTNYPATVERDRVATGATEVVTQSASSAINRSRRMITPSEEIVVAEGAAAAVRDRVVTGITEVTLLDGTNFPADISFPIVVAGVTEVVTVGENAANVDATRNVGGSTEAITVTGTNAIVSTSANRIVTGLVESITLIENASVVERDRVVVGTTEVVTINNPISDTNWNRIVTGATEVITATENAATVDTSSGATPRDVTGTTASITASSAAATVLFPRQVVGITELVALSAVPAGVNGRRVVGGSVELTALTENQATVERDRIATGATEVITAAESEATISFTANRIVTGLTAGIALAENAAGANMTRGVQSAVEALLLSENPATITKVRPVIGTTEAITVSGTQSATGRSRILQSVAEEVLLSSPVATVFRGANLAITAATAGILLTENAATIANGRVIVCSTSSALLTALDSFVNSSRQVGGATEVIEVTNAQAAVLKSRTGAQPGSMIYAHPDPEAYVVADGRMTRI